MTRTSFNPRMAYSADSSTIRHVGPHTACDHGQIQEGLETRIVCLTHQGHGIHEVEGGRAQPLGHSLVLRQIRRKVDIDERADGQFDGRGNAGPTASYDCDIVFSNGEFIQWPGRIHRKSIRASIQ